MFQTADWAFSICFTQNPNIMLRKTTLFFNQYLCLSAMNETQVEKI